MSSELVPPGVSGDRSAGSDPDEAPAIDRTVLPAGRRVAATAGRGVAAATGRPGASPDAAPVSRPLRGGGVLRRGADALRRIATSVRTRSPALVATTAGRGIAFAGTIWLGGSTEPEPGVLVLDSAGRVAELRRSRDGLPADLRVLGGAEHWVVYGLVDAHVHLGFDPAAPPDPYGRFSISGTPTGLVGLRDLGAPMAWAGRWRTGHRPCLPGVPFIAVSGPILTAAGGYPLRSWGSGRLRRVRQLTGTGTLGGPAAGRGRR